MFIRCRSTMLTMIIALLAIASLTSAQTYTVHEIEPPPSTDVDTWARTVNDAGVVFGIRELRGPTGSDAILYKDFKEFDVIEPNPIQNRPFVWPGAVNDDGTVVFTQVVFVAFEAILAFMAQLDNLDEQSLLFDQTPGTAGDVFDISNGQPAISVGRWKVDLNQWGAFRVITDGQTNPPENLGTLGGWFSTAEAINTPGQIVGASLTDEGPARAFLWDNGTMSDLGTLGGPTSWANDINDAGVVVGWSRFADGTAQPFRWQNGEITAIGSLGGDYGEANGINNDGAIVGMSFDAQGRPRAFLHVQDEMINLNTRIPQNLEWTLQYAQDINNAGVIVGWGRRNGQTRGFILEPIETPGDLNGDGIVNGADLAVLLGAWGTCSDCDECSADLDGNCEVDGADLAILLGNWG